MRLGRSATDFKHFSNKNGRFSVKTYHFCVIARRAQFFAPDAAIFNGTKRHPGTKFGETARSGMRPTCTPSPCTSCLVFPYKTAGRSKQIRLLLLFASGGLIRPTSLLGGVSTILRTASRFFIRSLCAFCRSHTGSDEKIDHPGRAERRLRLAGQLTKSFGGRLAPPFSVFLQRTRWLVLQTRKKCAIISVSKR